MKRLPQKAIEHWKEIEISGVPAMVHWVKNPTAVAQDAAEAYGWSLALLSVLKASSIVVWI